MMASTERGAGGIESRIAAHTRLGQIQDTANAESINRLCTILGIVGITVLTVRRWMLIGPYPPGLDGAQWLALGRGFNGFGRSTDGVYAPLVPVLAAIVEPVAGPLLAVRLFAALTTLALSLAVWFVAREALGPIWGLAAAAILIPASALIEPVLFGGYPQHLALTAGALALWASCRFLVGGDQRDRTLAGVATLIAAGAHHVFFPLVALSIPVAAGIWLSCRPTGNPAMRLKVLAVALAPGAALFAIVAFAFVRAGYSPPLDATARSAGEAWEYGTRESPQLWLAILIVAIASLAVQWRSRGDAAWLLAASLLVPGGLLLGLSGQPRLLPPVMIGAAIAAGLGCKRFVRTETMPGAIALVFTVTIAATLAISADRAAMRFADFYQVVDESLVQAAAAIEADSGSGTVAVRQDRRGWPIGWWFEALLKQPVIVGSDPRWLAFPDERDHAHLATVLFDGRLDPSTFQHHVGQAEVKYLVIVKWDWIGWERWRSTPGFPATEIYDDDRYLVLRVT